MTARGLNRFRCCGTRVDDLSRIRLNAYIRDRLMDQVTGARRRVDNGYLAPAAHGSVDATAEERGPKCERHRTRCCGVRSCCVGVQRSPCNSTECVAPGRDTLTIDVHKPHAKRPVLNGGTRCERCECPTRGKIADSVPLAVNSCLHAIEHSSCVLGLSIVTLYSLESWNQELSYEYILLRV